MDCCNYMQYRHHQPYYGSHCYDPLPAYHGDFYGQQAYQEYYGNPPYYPQQWPCAASFPDYVYNPKEARIRKAMRDATRERSIGTSPMLPRPNARRASSHGWVPSPHDDLMMSPLASMQPPSVCGFPLASSTGGGGQFMGTMNAYNKLEAAPPPMPPPTSSVHTNYMQSNPLAQLQQHAEMWPDYQTMRPRSSGNHFMMGEVPSYGQGPELGAPLMMEKQPTPATSPPTDDPEPEKDQGQEHFMPVFEQTDDAKLKQPAAVPQIHNAAKKPTNKPLPDFNEAFGSTERGRFQSPPDPRLAPNKGYIDYFFDSGQIKFDDYQI